MLQILPLLYRGTARHRAGRLAWLLTTAILLAQGQVSAQAVNPLDNDPRARVAGGSLFRAQCATCHGADAKGIQGIDAPDLTQIWSQPGKTDESVFLTIRNGVPGSIMPPHSFTDTEIWMLVSYLKSTGGAGADRYLGNADRGARLFTDNCSRCHRAGGRGGSLGPDLSRITAMRSKQALVASVRNPSATLVRGYRPVTLVTAIGRNIQGTLKSEDAFSIQIMDLDQNLRGFQKADLAQLRREDTSLMPVFNQRSLGDADLEDLLSYLASLARRGSN